ncbi:hypothetical protein CF65_01816 [Aggregatibacter actinomycetemcomitans HK1651]|nr:hypothetical protein CF65_01816 [Aggregatibacter actinomycetemcomitans HK1651]
MLVVDVADFRLSLVNAEKYTGPIKQNGFIGYSY